VLSNSVIIVKFSCTDCWVERLKTVKPSMRLFHVLLVSFWRGDVL